MSPLFLTRDRTAEARYFPTFDAARDWAAAEGRMTGHPSWRVEDAGANGYGYVVATTPNECWIASIGTVLGRLAGNRAHVLVVATDERSVTVAIQGTLASCSVGYEVWTDPPRGSAHFGANVIRFAPATVDSVEQHADGRIAVFVRLGGAS